MLFAPLHAESGRSDAVNTINDFVFTPDSRSAFENFTIVDDDVLEFDEIFIAEFSFGPEIANTWNARQVEPITAFILIRDDDCELCSDSSNSKFDESQDNRRSYIEPECYSFQSFSPILEIIYSVLLGQPCACSA